ncbi:P-loop containing nucleoside triphosphate hydrolase protein [Bombardia bombarda]|uniref:RNA helicase n=1 Tax=Bombardia bombarda TaxID=252184 RepID=A0AA39XJP1_9PEZI|nr:P-loop containing nucleoside triphosphate hydrolase protein [Bombardia bombarda]
MVAKPFVPRQRKRKVLDRQRAEERATHDGPASPEVEIDSNAIEITSDQKAIYEQKKVQFREKLKAEGNKISGKKAKRLERYIETKLRKDENRELLAKLAANKIDTSLFSSSRSIGQARETKKEALSRALRERDAGLASDKSTVAQLYQKRRAVGEALREDDDSDDSGDEEESSWAKPTPGASTVVGSGLKRPLEVDDSGRPILAKRQRRGGVKSRPPIITHSKPVAPAAVEWDGFGSEEDEDGDEDDESSGDDSEGSESESQSADDNSVEGTDEGSEGSEGLEEESGSEELDEADQLARKKEKSSAFKAWAHQQRNEALGYEAIASGPSVIDIPRPASFKPRPLEQDPLPEELLPTTNISRKAYSVAVTRDPEIQETRFRLPVVAEEQKIMEAIHNHDVVVICGATGSGKTTQVPQFLYEAGYGSPTGPTPGLIGVTQPRRVAAVSMSKRVGQEMGDHSHVVAYQIRFEGTVDPKTALKFMTDGVLLREAAQDIALRKYSAIIIDEAHERSVNTDILIAMLSRVVKLRADLAKEDHSVKPLKLIIMSATLRIEDLTQNPALFPVPPRVLEIEGREHSVTLHFARKTHHDYVEDAFRKISRGHKKLPPGGFLVFLTGQGEISALSKRLKSAFGSMTSVTGPKVRISANEAPVEVEDIDFGEVDDRNDDMDDEIEFASDDEAENAEFDIEDEESGTGPLKMHILPLYSLLPTKEQMRVFDPPPDGSRLVILATNVAETSLTIPGIRYVFDSGRAKERRYDPVSGVQSFEIGWISKASAKQRAGRAGRTGPGHCWRLYSSAIYERDFPEFAQPELLRMPIEGVVLQLKAMNLQHVVNFPFPTPPERSSLIKAEKLLTYLSALSPSGQVTQIGSTMSIFPLSPRFARILLVGHLHECLPYTIALVAGLSAGEVFIPENQAIPQQQFKAKITAHMRMSLPMTGGRRSGKLSIWCTRTFASLTISLTRSNCCRLSASLLMTLQSLVQALKQMVASGYIDQVAIRADKSPNPPEMYRTPKRAINVPYLPLVPLEGEQKLDSADRLVYIHPSSPLAHLSVDECPDYVVYSYLQKAGNQAVDSGKKPKTRMHALTDLTAGQLASLAKGTPLITYGKPIKEVKTVDPENENVREVWVVPYLRAEGASGGLGWPLPARKVKQRKVAGKGWVVE